MKIRTKLVLLLSAALVTTMGVSTWLRIHWTRQSLERRIYDQAQQMASDIANKLEKDVREDSDEDVMSEKLKDYQRRYPGVDKLELSYNSDEDTTVSFNLDLRTEDPLIKRTARPQRKQRPAAQRRDDTRRALYDHGESTRAPTARMVDVLWRTPDREESTRWYRLAPRHATTPRPTVKAITVGQPGQGFMREVAVPFDPDGPRHGQLTVGVSLEEIDSIVRTEAVVSAVVTGAAVFLLMIITAFIVDRVVGKPVEELEGAMHEVELGDLSRRVAERRADEIGALSRGFNSMLGRLSEANEEIRAFNRRLADEVRAATLYLERKNEALAQLNRLLVETRRELGDKERLAALGQLAAQLAHEMGTPLSSVSGHLQLAMHNRELPPAIKDRLGVANRELERVSRIVRDYLDSTRPVAPTRIPCDLSRVVDEAIGIAVGAQDRPGLRIERSSDAEVTQAVTDPGLVRQILVNLITNAIDATVGSHGGGLIRVGLSGSGGLVELSVTDDGTGIRAEDAARIFEPFYTTKGRGKGTGLGLAICRELATALGGRITVSSAPGAGSTFKVTLPREWGVATARIPRSDDTGKVNRT